MATPWIVSEMTLEQAEAEHARMRARSNPSTADLRRENMLNRRVAELRAEQAKRQPLNIAEPVAAMRTQLAALRGVS